MYMDANMDMDMEIDMDMYMVTAMDVDINCYRTCESGRNYAKARTYMYIDVVTMRFCEITKDHNSSEWCGIFVKQFLVVAELPKLDSFT